MAAVGFEPDGIEADGEEAVRIMRASARDAWDAAMWKASWTRHRQRMVAAKKAKKARAQTKPQGWDSPRDEARSLDPAMASLDCTAELNSVKMARAETRATKLRIKRLELSRGRKPAVAHMVHAAKVVTMDDKVRQVSHDVETTADEGGDARNDGFETESSPVSGPEEVPPALPTGAWPSLPPAEVLAEHLRGQRAAAARATREAAVWKASWTRHRQRMVAAKKAKKARAQPKPQGLDSPREPRSLQSPMSLDPALASLDCAVDLNGVKMARAETRATKLRIKRAELSRARDARDWTWGKGIEGANPHPALRAAARACLARGAVEAQEDMPSIVRMSPTETKGMRRKPAVARAVQSARIQDDGEDQVCDGACEEAAPVIVLRGVRVIVVDKRGTGLSGVIVVDKRGAGRAAGAEARPSAGSPQPVSDLAEARPSAGSPQPVSDLVAWPPLAPAPKPDGWRVGCEAGLKKVGCVIS